jgi:hypothetical protein
MVVNSVLDPPRSGKGEILQRRSNLGEMAIAFARQAESGTELPKNGGEEIAVRSEANYPASFGTRLKRGDS